MPFPGLFPADRRQSENKGVYGGYNWGYWTKPYQYYTPGKSGQRIESTIPRELDTLRQNDQGLYDSLQNNVFRWGQMPVDYAMNELGFDELDFENTDQLEELNNYLEENFPDIFQQGDAAEEGEDREPFEVTKWEPKELDVGDYTPTPTKQLKTSTLKIGNSPVPVQKLKIKGTSGFTK